MATQGHLEYKEILTFEVSSAVLNMVQYLHVTVNCLLPGLISSKIDEDIALQRIAFLKYQWNKQK